MEIKKQFKTDYKGKRNKRTLLKEYASFIENKKKEHPQYIELIESMYKKSLKNTTNDEEIRLCEKHFEYVLKFSLNEIEDVRELYKRLESTQPGFDRKHIINELEIRKKYLPKYIFKEAKRNVNQKD